MGLGVKKIYVENWKSISSMNDAHSRRSLRKSLLAPTIAASDRATAPVFIRNSPYYPFGVEFGYKDGEEYWFDASSYRHVTHINVPFLNITAQDDFLVSRPSRNKLGYCLSNPNVMVVETRCGGHLGWQETPPSSSDKNNTNQFGTASSSSWADTATADFFDAVMKCNIEMTGSPTTTTTISENEVDAISGFETSSLPKILDEKQLSEIKTNATSFVRNIPSRL
jgi:hypothetical protein